MIWHQIQTAKKDKRDLYVIFLNLANAFGSVPHELLWESFNIFHVPEPITTLVKAYFQDLQLCFTTPDFTTTWQRLEVGIMAGCTISPLAFTMAMEVIIRASRWVVGGERTKEGLRLPPIRAYMDDMTTLTTTAACTRRLLAKLQDNIKWAQMKIKPSKSRSISIVKGQLKDVRFCIGDDPIPTVSEQPVKSLGRWYNESLRWEGLERRKINWSELWQMEASNISFIIRAVYDVLPSPKNLHQWYGEDSTCPLCPAPATLRHIMTGCKTSLSQGRYTWRHNQVLKSLAVALETKRSATNSLPLKTSNPIKTTTFIREGRKGPSILLQSQKLDT
ncbi:unnamed protein product [Oncorhynchus mykiss]|uniref:Reverse transcriptase domain-containing protein n=1 Tax=Oncorhynchus mykiss TaxID=8022 RepID=A0A060XQ76_ONCMY|nr:unnamed protein product [Oncorhynchus mykiss]